MAFTTLAAILLIASTACSPKAPSGMLRLDNGKAYPLTGKIEFSESSVSEKILASAADVASCLQTDAEC